MKKKTLALVVILLLAGFSLSVSRKATCESDKVLAKVGEKVITQSDLDELVKMYEPMRRGQPATPEDKKNLLDRLINNLLISTEAEREKLDQKPEVQRRLKLYRNELLANEYIAARITPSVTVTDEEVNEILKKNPDLIPKEMLMLKEIEVGTEKEAEEISQELKKGADFSKIATEKSIAASKAKGGLLGTVSKGQLPPPSEAAVLELKEGQFSKPIKTAGGFKIYLLVSRKERPPEEMKRLQGRLRDKIIQLEKNKKVSAMIEKKVEELKKELKVETHFESLQ